jgi:hypothetical protein
VNREPRRIVSDERETMTITVDVNNRVGRLTFAAFAGAVLIGGSNFVAVKFSNLESLPSTALP